MLYKGVFMKMFNLLIKRVFDILASIISIAILTPLFLIVAIAIKCDSKGPVIYKQERRTKNGKVFKMYKFRSMINNAENIGTGLFNYEGDKRVTRVGKFLRSTSIDEIPQLFNVLLGTMSLVGPRPCVKYELGDYETLNKKYKKRFEMKAGITGLAQTKGRNNNEWEKKVLFDNEYIDKFKKYGVLIDIKILFISFVVVFKKEHIFENQIEGAKNDLESAKSAEERIIMNAHKKDEI